MTLNQLRMMRILGAMALGMATAAISFAQTRLADVQFTYFGAFSGKAFRVADECYVPLSSVDVWGWKIVQNKKDASLTVGKNKISVPVRTIAGQQAFPLCYAVQTLGGDATWDGDTLKVSSIVRMVRVNNNKFFIDDTLGTKPNVFALKSPNRVVVDLKGAKLDANAQLQLDSKARVGQFQPDVVRIVLETTDEPDLSAYKPEFAFGGTVAMSPPDVKPRLTDEGEEEVEAQTDPLVIDRSNLPKPPPLMATVGLPTIDMEGPTAALISMKLAKPLALPITFKRPDPTTLEVTLPGVFLDIPNDFQLESDSLSNVEFHQVGEDTVITYSLSRPMGAEVWTEEDRVCVQLLKPKVGNGKLAGKVIVIDAGHGGHDTGAKANEEMEKEINLSVAKLLSERLADEGATVILTRKSDVFITLKERAEIANRNKADFFLSVHVNSNGKENSTSGCIIFHHKTDPIKQLLAQCISNEIAKVSGLPALGAWSDQRIYSSGFSVLRNTKMPGTLIELGFINHNKDRKRMLSAQYQRAVALAIVNGLKVYLGNGKTQK